MRRAAQRQQPRRASAVDGTTNARESASASGTRTSASGHRHSFRLERRAGVERRELAADVVDDDAHDEDGDEEIEQDADLDEERHRLDEREAHDEDAVLEDEIAGDLGDAPCGAS